MYNTNTCPKRIEMALLSGKNPGGVKTKLKDFKMKKDTDLSSQTFKNAIKDKLEGLTYSNTMLNPPFADIEKKKETQVKSTGILGFALNNKVKVSSFINKPKVAPQRKITEDVKEEEEVISEQGS